MKRTSDLRGKMLQEGLFTFCKSAPCPRAIVYTVKAALFAASLLKSAVTVYNFRAPHSQ